MSQQMITSVSDQRSSENDEIVFNGPLFNESSFKTPARSMAYQDPLCPPPAPRKTRPLASIDSIDEDLTVPAFPDLDSVAPFTSSSSSSSKRLRLTLKPRRQNSTMQFQSYSPPSILRFTPSSLDGFEPSKLFTTTKAPSNTFERSSSFSSIGKPPAMIKRRPSFQAMSA